MLINRFIVILMFVEGALCVGAAEPQAVFDKSLFDSVEAPHCESDQGHISLIWTAGEVEEHLWYQLQCSEEESFGNAEVRFEGYDHRSFLSGLPDGDFYFRVRARRGEDQPWGPWSPAIHLRCTHHSMGQAWTLFSVGCLLFVGIVAFVAVYSGRLDRFSDSS